MSDLGDFTDFEPDEDEGVDGATDGESEPPDAADDVAAATAGAGAGAGASAGGGGDRPGDGASDDGFEAYDVETAGEERGIGVLSAADGLAIAEDERETCLRAYVTVGNRRKVRIGKYLLVPYPDGEQLFCRIAGLEYAREFRADDATEIHARRAMRSGGIDERDFKFVATLDPLAILHDGSAGSRPGGAVDESEGGPAVATDADDLQRRMPDRVPRPETPVRQATDAAAIKTGLKIPGDGVFLGHLSVGGEKVRTAAEPPTIDYRLRDDYDAGDPLVFRHTLVAGGTGSGKTHASKNLLRQYLAEDRTYPVGDGDREARPCLVLFDPQDEYAQMHDDGDLPDGFARRCEREGIACGGHEDTTAFVPKVGSASYAASHHRAEQVRFSIPFAMVHDNPWLIAGGRLNDNQYDALTYLLRRFRDEYGGDATYAEFRTFLEDPALKEELDESGRVHEATYDAVKRRALGFDAVFDRDARPITDLVHEFVRPGGISVVPTYHVNDSRATTTVVLALASMLVDQKLSNAPRYERIEETPLILGMDEAHNFLTEADSVQARKVIGKFTEAAKQGRKERLGLFLVTQDPQDVADPVFKQINTTVVLNLGDEDAISAVNIPPNLESKVPYMEQGQMVVYSPDNSEPVEVTGLSTCVTRHGRD